MRVRPVLISGVIQKNLNNQKVVGSTASKSYCINFRLYRITLLKISFYYSFLSQN